MKENPIVIELERGAVLSVAATRGTRVNCLNGVLWLTEDHDSRDIVLEAGRGHAVARRGQAVVQALEAARVAIDAPRVRPLLEIFQPAKMGSDPV